MNEQLITRNFQAMSEGLKAEREEMAKLRADGIIKDNRISALEQRLIGVEARLAIVFAKSMGSGATS